MTVPEIVADVARRLEAAGIPYAVGGSFASSTWGQMRQTNDADIAIRLSIFEANALMSAFPDPYYLDPEELSVSLLSSAPFRSVQLLHMGEAFKIDLFLLADGPYQTGELERAQLHESLPGVSFRVCSPENIVIAKLRWYVLGNRVSDRQWNDIVQVLEVQKGRLDETYLNEWSRHFGVEELLNKARSNVR